MRPGQWDNRAALGVGFCQLTDNWVPADVRRRANWLTLSCRLIPEELTMIVEDWRGKDEISASRKYIGVSCGRCEQRRRLRATSASNQAREGGCLKINQEANGQGPGNARECSRGTRRSWLRRR